MGVARRSLESNESKWTNCHRKQGETAAIVGSLRCELEHDTTLAGWIASAAGSSVEISGGIHNQIPAGISSVCQVQERV